MKYTCLFISLVLIVACNNTPASQDADKTAIEQAPASRTIDSIVGKMDVKRAFPDSQQIIKALSYTIIAGKDTSLFKCTFSSWRADKSTISVCKFSPKMTYSEQRRQLVKILAEANHDFDLKTMNTIGLGRLVSTGDLAAKVSSEFYAIKFQEELNAFLLHSQLAKDINLLLSPYGIKTKLVITEKQEFLPQKQLFDHSLIETPAKEITEEIVDCVVYLKLEKI